jgi:DNA polymerase III epsilon subunit-like protein
MNKLDINQRIYFADTETEGLNLNTSRPWEFAWVVMENGVIVDSQSRYLWWEDLNVNPRAAEVTGFNYKKYEKIAKCPKEVYKEIAPWFFGDNLLEGNGIICLEFCQRFAFFWVLSNGFILKSFKIR